MKQPFTHIGLLCLVICVVYCAGCKAPTPTKQTFKAQTPQKITIRTESPRLKPTQQQPTKPDPYDNLTDEGYLNPEQSEQWLKNNHFEFKRTPDRDGYIITCDHFIPGSRPGVGGQRWSTRVTLLGRSTSTISGPRNATATIDSEDRLRVKPY